MPKLKNRVPSYRLHRASGQAVVTLNGKDHYLGPYDSRESREQYIRLTAEWLTNLRTGVASPESPLPDLTVNELFVAYWEFAQSYYIKNGKPTGELTPIRQAMKPLTRLYGSTPAADFGPLRLENVRQAMIDAGLCRKLINARVNRIRRMFKWGVAKQMVPPLVLQSLQALAPLKRGRCNVRESEPVTPVPDAYIEATLLHVAPQVAAMIRLQHFTGMRPCEVTLMRGCDLDTTGKIWTYVPAAHKTEHHGRQRLIYLGPKAQAVLQPFLKPDVQAFLFSPKDAMEERCRLRRASRRTPMTPSQAVRTRRRKPKRSPGERYTTGSYGQAIAYACDLAFPPPEHLQRSKVKKKTGWRRESVADWKKRLGPEKWAELQHWRKAHRWSPNQLRHNAATFLRREFGIEAARVVLGHTSATVTEIYAELDREKAASIMGNVG